MLPRASLLSLFAGLAKGASDCYPLAPSTTGDSLTIIKNGETPNGFLNAAKGWNSWGVQASPRTTPSYPMSIYPLVNQEFIIEQCTVLADPDILAAGWDLCSVDGGWYSSMTDNHGRLVYNSTLFNIPKLSDYLHSLGLKLGLYSQPGTPCEAANKFIHGTNITVGSTFSGDEDINGNCYFDYTNPDTQLYHDSLLALWASWGVDMIKLDYITPGSIIGNAGYPADTSASATAYHNAIANSGRQIRLDLSANLCRAEPYLSIWEESADSIRVAVDINSYGASVFVGFWRIQQTIENYRQYVNQILAKGAGRRMITRPNLDNLFVANPASVTGVTDAQRIMLMSFWIGSSSNLLLGSDMTNIDDLGRRLLISSSSIAAAKFCNGYPMQPRNPGSGGNEARQLQAWLSGPSGSGEAYVLLTNLGENLGHGGYVTTDSGVVNMSISLQELGLKGRGYTARDVWFGNVRTVAEGGGLSAVLGDGEAAFWRLVPV
ncbi:hypothetical protein BDW74DRAFT_186949 [Aspergillus multicolor]|uniref:glycoside hydrolase family 27 protein n=1 Tax=Aspergillus multicolor TaxID=41759 RepID=UPI003CCD1F09